MVIIRVLDIVGALFGILLTLPIMLLTAIAVRLESPGPVLFVQRRVGKDNATFRIYKFRTMHVGTPEIAKDKLAGETNFLVTRVGRFLRRTSIDELPQLFNVLKGEMSLVGPRPALYNQFDLIEMRTELGVHRMRPGLTGLAQVMGREDMPLGKKVHYDRQLMETFSLATYIRLLLHTAIILLNPRGTY